LHRYFYGSLLTLSLALSLPGQGFVIPVYCGLLALGILSSLKKSYKFLEPYSKHSGFHHHSAFHPNVSNCLETKKILYGSVILTVLTFTIAPYFGVLQKENGTFISIGLYWLFCQKHIMNPRLRGKAKSSLLYVYDAESKQANWVTYDKT
jgi:hypothetical protein